MDNKVVQSVLVTKQDNEYSEVLPLKKIIRLDIWEEFIGKLESLIIDNGDLVLGLFANNNGEIRFPAESKEAHILKRILEKVKRGTMISILRTDIGNKPLYVKIIQDH